MVRLLNHLSPICSNLLGLPLVPQTQSCIFVYIVFQNKYLKSIVEVTYTLLTLPYLHNDTFASINLFCLRSDLH